MMSRVSVAAIVLSAAAHLLLLSHSMFLPLSIHGHPHHRTEIVTVRLLHPTAEQRDDESKLPQIQKSDSSVNPAGVFSEESVASQQHEIKTSELSEVGQVSQVAPNVKEVFSGEEGRYQQTEVDLPNTLSLISPCRALVLPARLASLDKLFPRKYSVDFTFIHDAQNPVFKVNRLQPEGEEYPYADRLIRSSFENCVNQLSAEERITFHRTVQASNPTPDNAYSVKIEFESRLTLARQNKGI